MRGGEAARILINFKNLDIPGARVWTISIITCNTPLLDFMFEFVLVKSSHP